VVGYDTIYAMQDREDDALVGIRSSALRMGENVRVGVALCYALALAGWGMAIWNVRPQGQALVVLLPAAAHLIYQVANLKKDGSNALHHFRSNKLTGLLVALACLVVGSAG
jgi:4-hydroxybenzoate polyprenyltransferase